MLLLLQYTLIFSSVLILVALGGCYSEHSGVINLGLEGIMVIGPHTDNKEEIRRVFREGRRLFEEGFTLRQNNVRWKTLSMGMSSDWKIAVEEGSTLLRLGRILFTEEDPQDI